MKCEFCNKTASRKIIVKRVPGCRKSTPRIKRLSVCIKHYRESQRGFDSADGDKEE